MKDKIKFNDLNIGQIFFDEYSDQYWRKIDQNLAEDGMGGVDFFDGEEMMIVSQDEADCFMNEHQ